MLTYMSTNTKYNFKEGQLAPDFAKEKLTEFKSLIEAGVSFVVLSMPGVGASYFLKYLVSRDFAYFSAEGANLFIHVDLYNLPTLNQHEFYRMLFRDLGGKPSS